MKKLPKNRPVNFESLFIELKYFLKLEQMRIYFLNEDNLQDIETMIKDLYISTLNVFERKLDSYYDKLHLLEQSGEVDEVNYTKIMMEELRIMINQLKEFEFKQMYIKWGIEILEKVRYASVSEHTDKCVARAVFDILFKYCFDFEYKIPHLCCNNSRFKTMQFEILRDLRWRLRPDYTQFI